MKWISFCWFTSCIAPNFWCIIKLYTIINFIYFCFCLISLFEFLCKKCSMKTIGHPLGLGSTHNCINVQITVQMESLQQQWNSLRRVIFSSWLPCSVDLFCSFWCLWLSAVFSERYERNTKKQNNLLDFQVPDGELSSNCRLLFLHLSLLNEYISRVYLVFILNTSREKSKSGLINVSHRWVLSAVSNRLPDGM